MSIFHAKRRRLFFLTEATAGTPTLDAALFVLANGKVKIEGLKCQPGIQSMDRKPDGLTFDNLDSVRWGEYYTVTFQTKGYTSGTAGTVPSWDPLMKACGCSSTVSAGVSVTYAPSSNSAAPVTLGIEMDNDGGTASKKIIVGGCLGSVVIATDALGKPSTFSWTFVGKAAYVSTTLQDLDSTPVASVVYDDDVANLVQFLGTTVTLGGVGRQVNSISFDRGLTTEWELDMADVTSYKMRIVADSMPKVTLDPAKVTNAAQADLAPFFKGTTGAVVAKWGLVAGKIMTLTLPRAQRDSVSDDARGVTSTYGITFHANRSSVTGNGDDAFTLVLT